MPVPQLPDLLAHLDQDHHTGRVRTMALLGRDHAGDPSLGPLLDALTAESGYHHHLALVAATSAGDVDRLRAALADPSPRTRSFAFSRLARLGMAPDDVGRGLLNGSAEERRRLRRFVNRNRLSHLAEAAIDDVRRELGDREAATLLATCGDATVRRLLPELLYALRSLGSLAHRHPGPLFDHLEAGLREREQRQRDILWRQVDTAVAELTAADPDRLLRLVEASGPSWVVPHGLEPVLGSLIRFAPARLAALIVDARYIGTIRWVLPPALRRNARRFTEADRVAIARGLRERTLLFFRFLGYLPPSEREAVFTQALADLDTSGKVWSTSSLDLLPHAIRQTEARRILALRSVRDSEAETFEYTALLPFGEARSRLESLLDRAKAEDRARGYRLLVTCADRERTPEAFGEVLRICRRLKNEQDPVRLATVTALAEVSPVLVVDDHLGDLRALMTAVVEARDTSSTTLQALATFTFRLLGHAATDPASARFRFALDGLDTLAGPTGGLFFPRLDRLLPTGSEAALVDALMLRLERDAALDRYQLAFSVTRALGRRAWSHARLQDLLDRATGAADDPVARSAITLWLHDPTTRRERVGRLLGRDESTVTVDIVLATLVRSRQDLLDVLLRPRPLQGRFLKGDVRYVPVIGGGFERWLPRQCASYRSGLDLLIATPATSEWSRAAAIRASARLPEIGLDTLAPYLASSDTAVQEAALGGLAWTDRPADALGRLLGYADTDRARVAVYAATRCARFVPRDQLARPLLAALARPDAKVTSRKEIARLLGAHRPPGAIEALLDLAAQEGTHRDIRLTIGRTLRGALDDDRVWGLYERLAGGTDDEVRSVLETPAVWLAPRHRTRYGELVLTVARSGNRQERAVALGLLGGWAPWVEGAPSVAADAVADLDSGPGWPNALRSLTQMLRDGTGWDELDGLVATLTGRSEIGPDLDAGPERDLPSAQRLTAVARLAELPAGERAGFGSQFVRVADRVGDSGAFIFDEMVVRLAAVDWDDPLPGVQPLVVLLDDHPLLAARATGDLAAALDRDQARWSSDGLGAAADSLIRQGTTGSATVAIQLVSTAGARFDWPETWRTRLRRLRSHPDADVARLAAARRTSAE